MDTRKEFLKKAALLAAATGAAQIFPPSIQRAFAINPEPGSTFLDAEHIVLLMQENRSFDHTFGSLQGVRGFNDPRAIRQPNKNLVWLQTNKLGETYAPYRYDIKNTKITWMGSLPHGWESQIDARNEGKCNGWLEAKKIDNKEYEHMPLTMGYYTREDLPFYYALADAFTVCDHNFCSSLTPTTPNRLHFWTGTVRPEKSENSKAHVRNEDTDYDKWCTWKTFPERLEENNISWKIYQNDISVDGGLTDEQDTWLDNFGDNPIEFFSRYNVKLSERYLNFLDKKSATLPAEIEALEKKLAALNDTDKEHKDVQNQLKDRKELLDRVTRDKALYTREKYNQLSTFEKNLHDKAFANNKNDPHYLEMETLKYKDGDVERQLNIQKGDTLHQFRQDVNSGKLPTVSWIVPPEAFSDHPSSAWFGAWYVSEVMDILTKNPEVWKKTVFILTYDENDGYFDHLPPFVAPNPYDATTGKTSTGIDTKPDFVTWEQEQAQKTLKKEEMRQSPIGLGWRVPMVIASPWSRGGYVNSQVFDHTSSLQFLEKFLSNKTGKKIEETNITTWRRTVCGDLTSVFRPYRSEKLTSPVSLNKELFIESIHKAKFKNPPTGYKNLTTGEMEAINTKPHNAPYMPAQEKGIRPANALPYEIYAEGKLNANKDAFEISFESGKEIFHDNAAGAPFLAYATHNNDVKVRSYAVLPGDHITDTWKLTDFENSNYHIEVHGPNGFYRLFKGNTNDAVDVACNYQAGEYAGYPTGNLEITVLNKLAGPCTVELTNNYTNFSQTRELKAHGPATVIFNLRETYGWYDVTVKVTGNTSFQTHYAGKLETGKETFTDPLMGRVI